MSSQLTIYVSNDNYVENPVPLTRADTGAYVNDATLTMTLKLAGVAVSGATSLSMPYVTDSNGRYGGTIPQTVSLTAGGVYTLEITAVRNSATTAFWNLSVDAVTRSA